VRYLYYACQGRGSNRTRQRRPARAAILTTGLILALSACTPLQSVDAAETSARNTMMAIIDPLSCSVSDETITDVQRVNREKGWHLRMVLVGSKSMSDIEKRSAIAAFRLDTNVEFITRHQAALVLGQQAKGLSVAYMIAHRRVMSSVDVSRAKVRSLSAQSAQLLAAAKQ
jgi:hypothetical protein